MFKLNPNADLVSQLLDAERLLRLNKFQRQFILSIAHWGYDHRITDKQINAANKILGKAKLWNPCEDAPCCGHSRCRYSRGHFDKTVNALSGTKLDFTNEPKE